MRLEKASSKAIRYAVLNWHYSKSVPSIGLAYAVFNGNGEWCGVVCFGIGATNNIASPYGLNQGQVVELVRVALNGKQESTAKAVSIALRLLKADAPNVRLVVSYADSEQGHFGTIYQASNWFYVGFSIDTNLIVNGVREHRRTLTSRFGTNSAEKLRNAGHSVSSIKTKPKYKYVFPVDKKLIEYCKSISKPYPKCVQSIDGDAPGNQSGEGGSIPT